MRPIKGQILKAKFSYNGKTVEITNVDPSLPDVPLRKPWKHLTQEIFDQLEDSKQFTHEELDELAHMMDAKFLSFLLLIESKEELPLQYKLMQISK